MSSTVTNNAPPQAAKPVILDDGMSIDTAAGHARSGRVPQEAFVEWLAGRDVPADRLAVFLANGLLTPADFAFILEARDRRSERKGKASAKCKERKRRSSRTFATTAKSPASNSPLPSIRAAPPPT